MGKVKNKHNYDKNVDNVFLNFISFICPIVGFVLYFTMRKKKNINYRRCGKFALFGFIVFIILVIAILIILYISLSKVNNFDISKFSDTLKDEAILIYNSENANGEICYKISDITINGNYYGSVKVFNDGKKLKVKTYVSDGSTYLVSEYIDGKKKRFNMKTSDRLNLVCSDV
ncbi:MAG: hypothetical protein ACI31S_04235 [Bacilli bacterium]